MDDLSVNLNKLQIGCLYADTIVWMGRNIIRWLADGLIQNSDQTHLLNS